MYQLDARWVLYVHVTRQDYESQHEYPVIIEINPAHAFLQPIGSSKHETLLDSQCPFIPMVERARDLQPRV
jgi:hypothetical protein